MLICWFIIKTKHPHHQTHDARVRVQGKTTPPPPPPRDVLCGACPTPLFRSLHVVLEGDVHGLPGVLCPTSLDPPCLFLLSVLWSPKPCCMLSPSPCNVTALFSPPSQRQDMYVAPAAAVPLNPCTVFTSADVVKTLPPPCGPHGMWHFPLSRVVPLECVVPLPS